MSRPDLQQLERDLRDARVVFDDVPVSADAWQRNQELVAAASSDGRRSTLMAVAAGVVVLLVIAAGWLALGGRDQADDVPGSGGKGSSDSSSGEMADPIQVARIDLPDGTVTLEVGMEQHKEKADEPSLCYRMNSASSDGDSASGGGGCTSKVDRADLPDATVDYLTGSNDEVWTMLSGAVDRRTAALTMWLADGTARDLELHALPGTELRAFGSLGNTLALVQPVRLVAWADRQKKQVVESVDIVERFDLAWLPGEKADCGSVQHVPDVRFAADGDRPAVRVRASFTDAEVTSGPPNDGSRTVCVPLGEPAALTRVSRDWVAVVVAPEVAGIEGAQSLQLEPVGTTIWRTALVRVPDEPVELAFVDAADHVVQRISVPAPT